MQIEVITVNLSIFLLATFYLVSKYFYYQHYGVKSPVKSTILYFISLLVDIADKKTKEKEMWNFLMKSNLKVTLKYFLKEEQ